jgi:hypothetical protein
MTSKTVNKHVKHGTPIQCFQCVVRNNNNSTRIRQSVLAKERWQNQTYVEKQRLAHIRLKSQKSATTKQLWNDPKFRDKVTKNAKQFWNTSEGQLIASNKSKKMWENPEFRDKITKSSTALWKKDEFRHKIALAGQPSISKPHKLLMSLLDDMGIQYTSEHVIGPWGFDIFIPSKKLLIEVQGDWVHSQPHKQIADRQKATYVERYCQGYILKYLWEHEFYVVERIRSLIQLWCGIQTELIDFEFSNVVIKPIERIMAIDFIGKYHYLGNIGRSGDFIGAFIGEELAAVAIYARCVRKEVATSIGQSYNDTKELTRFCIHPSYHKYNFASWCISRMSKFVDAKCLIAFADSTYNHLGTIYKASGWKLVSTVPPDYWYTSKDGFVMHKKTLWNRASNLKMSEQAFADKYGFIKVHGFEKYKYVFMQT